MYIYSPLENFTYLKYPAGNIFQLYGESIDLYRKALSSPDYDFTGGHNGIDCMPILDPIKFNNKVFCTEGEVVEVKNTPEGYGKHVRILTKADENGNCLEVTYGHLSEIFVKIGQTVANGEFLGIMGNTGYVISGGSPFWGNAPAGKGVHLHLTIREASILPTPWQTMYSSGKTVFVKNYNNGCKGAVDPLHFIKQESGESLQIRLLTIFRDLLRKFILLKGQTPIA